MGSTAGDLLHEEPSWWVSSFYFMESPAGGLLHGEPSWWPTSWEAQLVDYFMRSPAGGCLVSTSWRAQLVAYFMGSPVGEHKGLLHEEASWWEPNWLVPRLPSLIETEGGEGNMSNQYSG